MNAAPAPFQTTTDTPMPSSHTTTPARSDLLARAFFFLVLVALTIGMPNPVGIDLDPSWRMAMGYFFREGFQFGRDVVFTYGPLGFLLANTDDGGGVLPILLVWQVVQAVVLSGLVFQVGLRLSTYWRYLYFVFFFVLGLNYHDIAQQFGIALAGFALLRQSDKPSPLATTGAGLWFALLGLIKFTNFVLAAAFVVCVAGLHLWQRRPRAAAWMAGTFSGGFLLGWTLCRQNPLNLPAFFYNSWEISQGYQESMGVPTPTPGLWMGLSVLGLIVVHALLHLVSAANRPRAIASVLALGAFTYLNWKHGFVRADGHMIGFFYGMLLPITAYPALLGDGSRRMTLQRSLLVVTGILALIGVSHALPGFLRAIAGYNEDRLLASVEGYAHPARLVKSYAAKADQFANSYDLPLTRSAVGQATIDVLGHEQAIALLNRFNYRPRPVFQGYSAYRPHLAELNFAYYASDRAPEFVLAKTHTIDRRLVALDDSRVLKLLLHRYEFVHLERDYQLWRRKPGAFDPATLTPQPLTSGVVPLGEMWDIGSAASSGPLWATVDVKLNLLGKLRSFFYKPPQVTLHLQDSKGNRSGYRMPLPEGRTGFLANPIVEDAMSLMRHASSKPERLLQSLGVTIAPQDADCFERTVEIKLARIPLSTAGENFFRNNAQQLFNAFKVVPLSFSAQAPLSNDRLDGQPVMVFHAPSEMIVAVPDGAKEFAGRFGFIPGAYNGGSTDGADFSVKWRVDGTELNLWNRKLTPVQTPDDRGLQSFTIALPPGRKGGELVLRISPGANFAWDWTAWGGLEFR